MKKTLILIISAVFALSCSLKKEHMGNIVGADRDTNGCKASAGQTWSALKQTCIQVFNEGTRLNPIKTTEDEVILSAFVLFNNDASKLELFLPNEEHTFIINKTATNTYNNNKYTYHANEGILYVDQVKTYAK